MRVVSHNIKNNPDISRAKVRQCARESKALAGVCGFQEIGEGDDQEDLKDVFGEKYEWANMAVSETPQCWPTKGWRLATKAELPDGVMPKGVKIMHKGKADTSPTRRIVWVVLVQKKKKTTTPTVFMNTHFVSGVWSPKPKINRAWRKEMWHRHWEKMQEQILYFNDKGLSVIFMGDFNRMEVSKFTKKQRWLNEHGIDKIGFCPAPEGSRLRLKETGKRKTPSDHDLIYAVAQLVRPKA